VCSLLRKNIKRSKERKKIWTKKRKEKNSKREEKRSKRSTQGTLDSSIVCGAFCLIRISIATFHTCFTPLCVSAGARNMYRLAIRTSALDIYSILLFVTELCATYIYLFFVCLPSSTYILQISTEKVPCNLSATPSQVSRTSHRLYRPLLCVGKNTCKSLVRYVRVWFHQPINSWQDICFEF
jgi:hypothetical protein